MQWSLYGCASVKWLSWPIRLSGFGGRSLGHNCCLLWWWIRPYEVNHASMLMLCLTLLVRQVNSLWFSLPSEAGSVRLGGSQVYGRSHKSISLTMVHGVNSLKTKKTAPLLVSQISIKIWDVSNPQKHFGAPQMWRLPTTGWKYLFYCSWNLMSSNVMSNLMLE